MAIDTQAVEESLTEKDPDWINEEQPNEVPEKDRNAEYEFELFLSTDGKHTVHVKSDRDNKNRAMKVATETYDYILTRYGTKQGQAVKEYGNGRQAPEVNQETCKHVNVKFAQSKTDKNPDRWFKGCRDCGKFLGWQQ